MPKIVGSPEPWCGLDEQRIYAFLSYLAVLCAIPLILKKDDAFVQPHACQGLVLFLCEFLALLVTIILPGLLKPFLLVFGILSLWGMIKALKGQTAELPFISVIARRLSL